MATTAKNNFSKQPDQLPNITQQEEKIHRYQISELHKEIEYLNQQLSFVPKPVQLICKKLKELIWTMTSIIGLGWLHDGTQVKALPEADDPTISLPIIPYREIPSPRLFLDVTATYKTNTRTGVQRVIREICRHGIKEGSLAPTIIDKGKFVTVPDLIPIQFEKSDQILILDSSWTITKIYPPALKLAQSQGADIILGIHDLIPDQYPGFVHPYFSWLFADWLTTITPFCSRVLAVSQYSASCFINWMSISSSKGNIQKIGWFHLGANIPADIKIDSNQQCKNERIPNNYFLSIGTIEPRKGYSISLDAFDLLWSKGNTQSYVIIGRKGDLGGHLIDRIINHKEFGKKLFWPQDVNDELLEKYYRDCNAVIIPTLAEGFGLPLIEATFYGKKIIATDLPVFREISTEGVVFFPVGSSIKLAETISSCSRETLSSGNHNALSWSEATKKMIDLVKKDNYQITL